MCFSCWPWEVNVADAPTKDEYIFLGKNHTFYPDHRVFIKHHELASLKSKMPTYYAYGEHNPQLMQDPDTGRWESIDDWPRTYTYIPAYDSYQGFHPPAPVYHGHTQGSAMYYSHNSGNPTPTPYYANGYYYAASSAPTTGYYCYPTPNRNYNHHRPRLNYNCCTYNPYLPYPKWDTCSNPYSYSAAQAAAAAAAAATANRPTYYVGATRAEIDAQNAAVAYNTGATIPTQLAPYKPAAGQQFWCKELDKSWTLRTYSDIMLGELSPGHWEMAKTGYHYWVRSSPM